MIETFSNLVIKLRWPIVFLSLIAALTFGSGARFIEFSSNYRIFFSEDNEQLVAFETLQNTYSKSDNIFFVIEPKSGAVFNHSTLTAIEEFTDKSWLLPYSTRVDSITNFQHTYAAEDDLVVENLVGNLDTLTTTDLLNIKNIAIHEPLLIDRLISKTAHVTAINVTIQLPEKTIREVPEAVSAARALAEEMEAKYPDIKIHITGAVMLNNAFSESAQNDLATLIPLMFLVVIITLALFLRSISATIATLIVIIFSIMGAMGSFGWLDFVMSPPVASAPTIILTIAIADCVHILVTTLNGMSNGLAKNDAIKESLRINLQPIFITSLTTLIGFLTMNFSEVPPFRHLGNAVAIGVCFAFIFSITFLPALISILPVKARKQSSSKRTAEAMAVIADFVIKNRKQVLAFTASLAIVLTSLIPLNQINNQFVGFFDTSVQFRQDTDFTIDNLTGLYTILYSFESEEDGGISDPIFLADLEKLVIWMNDHPYVVHVNSISDIFKRLNRNMNYNDETYYRLPENKELASQYLLLYEMSLPYGLDLNDQINVGKTATKVTITLADITSAETLAFEVEVNEWVKANTNIKTFYAASPNLMFSHIGYRNVKSMMNGTLIAIFLISFTLIFALRNLKIGVLSIIPNLIPATCAFGIWAIIDGNVGISVSTVVGMTLGIVVDDTIHFLSKYLRARRESNMSAEEAVHYAFSTVGVALIVTTAVLVAGFLILSMSTFELNSNMGIMTALTISLALFFDFLLLPTLLITISKRSGKD